LRTRTIDTPNGAVAVHEAAGAGPPAVLIHGNSSSSRAFSRQLDGPLGERFRLVAVDLPGHGASADAEDPALYSVRNQAKTLRAAIEALGLDAAPLVGWSLGGHLALEMAPDLPHARGFMIFGAPPIAVPPAMAAAFMPNPVMGFGFAERRTRDQASAYVTSFFKPGFAEVAAFFLEDALRADGRARRGIGASLAAGGYTDEAIVVRDLKAPLAVLHGADDQLINGAYFASLAMPTLWRGAVQTIAGAGHAPQWETPQAFDALLAAFIAETE
jgi:pimeloyl-ACP methyl ester carboxylesterase